VESHITLAVRRGSKSKGRVRDRKGPSSLVVSSGAMQSRLLEVAASPQGRPSWKNRRRRALIASLGIAVIAVALGVRLDLSVTILAAGLLIVMSSRQPLIGLTVSLGTAALLGTGLTLSLGESPVRLVDAATLIAVTGALVHHFASNQAGYRLGSTVSLLLIAGTLLAHGVATNPWPAVRADLYVISFLLMGWILAVEVSRFTNRRFLLTILLVLFALTALKAITIAVLRVPATGPESLSQAWSSETSSGVRTILVGGDTFLIIGPAFLAAGYGLRRRGWTLALMVVSLCFVGILISQTRTSLAGAMLGFLAGHGIAWMHGRRTLRRSFPRWPILLAGLVLLIVLLLFLRIPGEVQSVGLPRFDEARTGPLGTVTAAYAFRAREAESAMASLSGPSLVLGRGFGADFTFVEGAGGSTVWSHNVFIWVLLKAGVVGLAVLLLTGLALLTRTVSRLRGGLLDESQVALAAALITLVGVSVTTNKIVSVEGMLLSTMAVAFLTRPEEAPGN
jgi:hypothetical protein